MNRLGLALAVLVAMAYGAPSAIAQSCSEFQQAADALMAAENDLDAQVARFKGAGQAPRFDAGVCNAEKALKQRATSAVGFSSPACDPEQHANDFGVLAQSADHEISLFCAPAAATPSTVQSSQGGFIFPDSDQRQLTIGELQGLSRDQLRIARNEIYARKGRYFQDQGLKAHFSQYSWYQPSQWDVTLNATEKANVSLIQSMERQ